MKKECSKGEIERKKGRERRKENQGDMGKRGKKKKILGYYFIQDFFYY